MRTCRWLSLGWAKSALIVCAQMRMTLMRNNWLYPAGSLAFAALFTGMVLAQPSESLTEHKKSTAEFKRAEEQLQKQEATADVFQRELNQLMEQKLTWQREVDYAHKELDKANGQLDRFSKLGMPADVAKSKQQVSNWDARLKTAVVELEKVEVDIRDKIRALQDSIKVSAENSVIVPGDSVEVFVTEDETLNGVYQVRQGGYIILPRVGRITLVGKDLGGAEQAIKEALGISQIRDATVMVERPAGGGLGSGAVIYLSGEFLRPGAWKIPPGVSPTIVTAILRSGGLRPDADLTKVRLLRLVTGQALVEEVNVQAIMNGAGLPSDLALKPGDIVFVPAFANVVYVTGNVLKPGAFKLLPDDELTVYSAILRAGGFARFANRKKVYVLRDQGNGAKQKIPVSIKELQAGQGSDIILKSKDIVVVPERFFSF
jgi:protein involved in polysaccharide export with SLBB domain